MNPMGEMRRSTDSGVRGVDDVNATEILDALRVHWKGAALVPELCIDDEHELALVDVEHEAIVRRCDALMFDDLIRTTIEIKVDRADVKRETWAKIRPWRRVTHRFIYAVPAGLIDKPPVFGCGLVWVHDDGTIEWRRKCSINRTPEPLPQKVVQALAFRAATGAARSFNRVEDAHE